MGLFDVMAHTSSRNSTTSGALELLVGAGKETRNREALDSE